MSMKAATTACKLLMRKQADFESNPYHIALGFCLETLYEFLQEKQQHEKKFFVVVECRGKKEDNELELEESEKPR